MKKLIILILIFLFCAATSFAQYKGYTVQATTRLQADNVFFWKGDTIKKDSLVYAEIKPDSIRFRRINGAFTKWYKLKFDIYKLKSDSVDLKGYLSNYKGLGKEDKSNKVISISSGSTDIQYPSAKLLFDQLGTKEPTITSGTSLQYWRGDKTWQTLNKSAVGLDNVDNTSDLLKPISNAAQTALNAKENSITKGSTAQYFRGDMSLATMPTSLPASDVYAWAKAETKPTYTYSEVGAASSSHNHDGSYDYYAAWIPAVNGTNGPYGVDSWNSFNFISGPGISLSLSGLSMTISATGGGGSITEIYDKTIALSDETTDLTAATSVRTFRMPTACTITGVRASVNTAPTGSTIIVDINENGTSILSTKLSIDAGEKTSTTAATPAVISDSAIADDAEITVDIDKKGSTIAGNGLKLVIYYTKN